MLALLSVKMVLVERSVRVWTLSGKSTIVISEDSLVWISVSNPSGDCGVEGQVSSVDGSCAGIGGLRMVAMRA